MEWYVKRVKARAKFFGYNEPELLKNSKHKFKIETPEGKTVKFGQASAADFHIWKLAEQNNEVPAGYARERQRLYLARATNIKGKWRENKYSPNNLSIHLLWS